MGAERTKTVKAQIVEAAREVAVLVFVFGGILPEHIETAHRWAMIVGSPILYTFAIWLERAERKVHEQQ